MSARSAAFVLVAVVALVPGTGDAHAQDTAAIRQLGPALQQVQPSGEVMPGVLEVDPEVLQSAVQQQIGTAQPPQQTPPSAVPDTVRYLSSRVGAGVVRERVTRGLPSDRQSFVLPYRILPRDDAVRPQDTDPDDESDGRPGLLRPVIQVGAAGLSFGGSAEGYRGRVYVGVQDSLQPGSSRRLPEPIHFLLDVSPGSVEPSGIAVEHTNLPFREATVVTREIRDSVRLQVRSSVHGEPVSLTVPVRRPSLSMTASPPEISGLGLETATLTVSADRLPRGEVTVTLESTKGRPEPSPVVLGEDGMARVTLRSTLVGTAEVRARSPGYRSGSTRVRFGVPLVFLAVAVLGGLAGGTARYYRSDDGGEPGGWRREAGVAVVFGLIVAVAYGAGVNVLGLEIEARYGEALVFTLAALGGLFRIPGVGRSGSTG